ncbi:hypothetical protein [Falsiroseomonas sp. HW251]|uniref:hypothetical protein n=1 Tax=Falsiroseomonas sp. HW251 TaxID=3390998 RepID=UPI003D31E6B5
MGVWGAGLHAGDVARDLKGLIAAVARLPLGADDLLGLLVERYRATAEDPDDEDHTVFWLVVADGLGRLGIDCPMARERALAIIDSGRDLAMCEAIEMDKATLRKRAAMLAALRETLARGPAPGAKRRVLTAPQPFIMEMGEAFAFPTCRGQGINAHFPSPEADPTWRDQDGWGAGLVCERGHAFGHLAWYRLCVLGRVFADEPTLDDVRGGFFGCGLSAGTCTKRQFERMRLKRIGTLPVRAGAILDLVPELLTEVRSGEEAAILDVCITSNLRARTDGFRETPVADVLAG